jgi:protein-S-isoprenylcysteine O-methyltransferase Ste14
MHRKGNQLDRYGRREMIGHLAGPVIIALLFFLSAGRLDLYRAWIWAGLTVLYYLFGLLVLLKVNPGLLNESGGVNRRKDSKKWDRMLLVVYAGTGLYGHVVLMALDAGRFGWSHPGPWLILPGILLYTASFNLVYWAMAVNPHFETTVRIQSDRDHSVVSWGPYQIVRHPGYLGLAMADFGSAMIIGSLYGFITAAATVLVLVIRTCLEDLTLKKELEGYREYAAKTRYRLIPRIW